MKKIDKLFKEIRKYINENNKPKHDFLKLKNGDIVYTNSISCLLNKLHNEIK
jgi:hypothetical protein